MFWINKIYISTPSKNSKIYDISIFVKMTWFTCTDALYNNHFVCKDTHHVIKMYIWRHKNASHIVLDIAVNFGNEDLKIQHFAWLEYFFSVILILPFFYMILASDILNIAAYDMKLYNNPGLRTKTLSKQYP